LADSGGVAGGPQMASVLGTLGLGAACTKGKDKGKKLHFVDSYSLI